MVKGPQAKPLPVIQVWFGDDGENELLPQQMYLAVYAAGGGKRNMANFVQDSARYGENHDGRFRPADIYVNVSDLDRSRRSKLCICRFASNRGEWVLKPVPQWNGQSKLKLVPEWFKARFWDNKQEKKHPWFMFTLVVEEPDKQLMKFCSNPFPVHQYYPTGVKKTDPNDANCRIMFHRVLKQAPSTSLRRELYGASLSSLLPGSDTLSTTSSSHQTVREPNGNKASRKSHQFRKNGPGAREGLKGHVHAQQPLKTSGTTTAAGNTTTAAAAMLAQQQADSMVPHATTPPHLINHNQQEQQHHHHQQQQQFYEQLYQQQQRFQSATTGTATTNLQWDARGGAPYSIASSGGASPVSVDSGDSVDMDTTEDQPQMKPILSPYAAVPYHSLVYSSNPNNDFYYPNQGYDSMDVEPIKHNIGQPGLDAAQTLLLLRDSPNR
jgi:hypothetical protein